MTTAHDPSTDLTVTDASPDLAVTDSSPDLTVSVGDDIPVPRGFLSHVANVGIKDGTTDFSVLASEHPCVTDAVFTRSRFAIVTVSKNANVATGDEGLRNAVALAAGIAAALEVPTEDVYVASTGVIGRQYPMEKVQAHLDGAVTFGAADLPAVARAMMTTDTVPKLAAVRVGDAVVAGVAKGVGMIEPDMATMLTYLVTDADVPAEVLRPMFRRVVDRTFNCLSVDTDTSTSDTAIVLANGAAGPVGEDELEAALGAVAESLVRQLARDGEGATKLLTVTVTGARDGAQAKRVAKAVVNSPLVKTAVHGADPNWGRVVMAVGKCSDDTDIRPQEVRVSFGGVEAYPAPADDAVLTRLAEVLQADEVEITVGLATGAASARVWGCDLSDGYVRINADYTT
jgi:glutamate N-acetyltransferase/amino-acid N-acetyltransferase